MLVLKACPRCHGDLVLEMSPGADYFECLQCGHVLSGMQERQLGISAVRAHQAVAPTSRRRPVPAGAAKDAHAR